MNLESVVQQQLVLSVGREQNPEIDYEPSTLLMYTLPQLRMSNPKGHNEHLNPN